MLPASDGGAVGSYGAHANDSSGLSSLLVLFRWKVSNPILMTEAFVTYQVRLSGSTSNVVSQGM